MNDNSDNSDNKQEAKTASKPEQQQQQQQRSVLPSVDLFEDESGITLLANMPGVPRDKLELKVEGDTLVIEGSMQLRIPEGLETIYAEVRVPRYRRSFGLTRELDTTKIDAKLKDGVLTLRIPKQPNAQPRRIVVSSA